MWKAGLHRMIEQRVFLSRIKHLRIAKLARIFVFPYKNLRIIHRYHKYLKSDDCQVLERLKDTHKGERCFIIGNGPSLQPEDLDKLKHEYTFASNRIYEIFNRTTWRPTVYLSVDQDFIKTEFHNIDQVKCDLKLLPYYLKFDVQKKLDDNIILIWVGAKRFKVNEPPFYADKSAYIPLSVAQGFSEGRTVTFYAIQMAVHMGFKEIFLLGVDFSYSRVLDEKGKIHVIDDVEDYFNQKTYDTTCMCYVPTKHAYTIAKEYCEAHNINIRNATRGGRLEVFERVDFDSLFPNTK